MKITVFGAGGATGRLLARQALDAGHAVTAVTRRPAEFPLAGERLTVIGADVSDGAAVTPAIAGADAVLSSLGVPFTRAPITVYSQGTARILEAMARHGVKRLAVVSSTAVDPHPHSEGGFVLNRIMQPMIARTIGRTTYADMRAMEGIVRESGAEWTIIRSAGLFDADRVSRYTVSESPLDGVFTSRADLADCLLTQATGRSLVGRTVEITTGENAPTLLRVIRREAFGRD
ncbi:NAD(P)-dependent oxidoreductase [Parafrankia discariae]|uniref:NAD(P)-dependent oxidoreductase n=1 Tax=Parafrankia discariae TaxID=365528 RepID=UPI00035DDFEE|nr:NAD(P)H-binding protein [Parafrankia discariae]